MSQNQACVGSIEDVRHDHTYFVNSSCRLKNKVNDLIDTANDLNKRLKRSHPSTDPCDRNEKIYISLDACHMISVNFVTSISYMETSANHEKTPIFTRKWQFQKACISATICQTLDQRSSHFATCW